MTSRLNDKQLILGQIGPMMRVSCAQHQRFDEDTTSLPSRNVCSSCFMAQRFTDNKSANWTNENREGIGSCPGPTIKAFSDLCDANEDSRLRRPLVTLGDTKVERVGATGGLSSRR